MWYLLLLIPAALIVFVAILLIRASRFTPKAQPMLSEQEEHVDRERAIEALCTLVRCKTVSYTDHSKEDDAEFEKLISLLPTLYPNVAKQCEMTKLPAPDRGLLFRWQGKTEGDPTVLMAHYDVVPVNAEAWDVDPFAAVVKDGRIFGRGTLDTKVTFGSILLSADQLIAEGFTPEHDIYFAFSGGEEVNGEGAIRRRLLDMGITPSAEVYFRKKAPLGDPIEISIRGYELTLRKAEANFVEVEIY